MALDSGRVGMLNMLAEKVVQPPISPRHMSYCPSMDLIACASIDGQVTVYRLNGQKVLTVNSKTVTAEVNGIEWKPNGKVPRTGRSSFHFDVARPDHCRGV